VVFRHYIWFDVVGLVLISDYHYLDYNLKFCDLMYLTNLSLHLSRLIIKFFLLEIYIIICSNTLGKTQNMLQLSKHKILQWLGNNRCKRRTFKLGKIKTNLKKNILHSLCDNQFNICFFFIKAFVIEI